jgi:SHS2 domain-containing protein
MGTFELLEHTADVGLAARAETLEALFETATQGMATIAGVWSPGHGDDDPVRIHLDGSDIEGLLVDWLNEVLYEHDSRRAALRRVSVEHVDDSAVSGFIDLVPLSGRDDEGVQIKAVTYHQLQVRRADGGWQATVFFDV